MNQGLATIIVMAMLELVRLISNLAPIWPVHSIDIRAVCLDLGSYGNRSTRFRDFVVGICESREY